MFICLSQLWGQLHFNESLKKHVLFNSNIISCWWLSLESDIWFLLSRTHHDVDLILNLANLKHILALHYKFKIYVCWHQPSRNVEECTIHIVFPKYRLNQLRVWLCRAADIGWSSKSITWQIAIKSNGQSLN